MVKKETEEEAEIEKTPVKRVGGKLVKEGESQGEATDFKPPIKKESEDEDEEEEETEEEKKKKKKKTMKADGSGVNPEESATQSTSAEHTTTTGEVINTSQNVFVPSSSVSVDREQSTPMGKSATVDLMKSPLWINLTKQMDEMKDALNKKFEATFKSANDRLDNLKKAIDAIEKMSLYKSVSDEAGPEGLKSQPLAKQLADGNVRFRNK